MLTIGAFARQSRLSPKALRLYDELGLIVPARVDPDSGYRRYEPEQLERARFIGWLRRAGMPLSRIRVVCDADPREAAAEIAAYWAETRARHAEQADLVAFLVGELTGKDDTMHDVRTRDVPERTLLTTTANVTADRIGAFTIELTTRLAGAPSLPGADGAPFLVYHGEVGADGDGPVEWCRPVPAAALEEVRALFPDLSVRTDPAHGEAFVRLSAEETTPAGTLRAMRALGAWEGELTGPPIQSFVADPQAPRAWVSDLIGRIA
ncbi:MAG: MerR family transcriptional regulator [Nonomuraea sp.]|nr:MerR family transcriptional regulator [Nonomuraea sp.]